MSRRHPVINFCVQTDKSVVIVAGRVQKQNMRNSSLSFLKSTGGGQFGEEDEQLIEAGPGRPPVASATAVAQYMHTVTVHHWKLY